LNITYNNSINGTGPIYGSAAPAGLILRFLNFSSNYTPNGSNVTNSTSRSRFELFKNDTNTSNATSYNFTGCTGLSESNCSLSTVTNLTIQNRSNLTNTTIYNQTDVTIQNNSYDDVNKTFTNTTVLNFTFLNDPSTQVKSNISNTTLSIISTSLYVNSTFLNISKSISNGTDAKNFTFLSNETNATTLQNDTAKNESSLIYKSDNETATVVNTSNLTKTSHKNTTLVYTDNNTVYHNTVVNESICLQNTDPANASTTCNNRTNDTLWSRANTTNASFPGNQTQDNFVQIIKEYINRTNDSIPWYNITVVNISNNSNPALPQFNEQNYTRFFCVPLNSTQQNCTLFNISNITSYDSHTKNITSLRNENTTNNLTSDYNLNRSYSKRTLNNESTPNLLNSTTETNSTTIYLNGTNLTQSNGTVNNATTNSSGIVNITQTYNFYQIKNISTGYDRIYLSDDLTRNFVSNSSDPSRFNRTYTLVDNVTVNENGFFVQNHTEFINSSNTTSSSAFPSFEIRNMIKVDYKPDNGSSGVFGILNIMNLSATTTGSATDGQPATTFYYERLFNTTNQTNYTAATPVGSAPGNCLTQILTNETVYRFYRNDSSVLTYNYRNECRNSSGNAVTTISYFLVAYTNGTVIAEGYTTPPPARRRRMLMQVDEAHLQGTATTGPTTGTQVFSGVTVNNVPAGNWVWVSCFTGFGYPSLVEINTIVDREPTIDDCITVLRNNRPNYTVDKLRSYVENWKRNNPNASYD
jgi:hypothetical protein